MGAGFDGLKEAGLFGLEGGSHAAERTFVGGVLDTALGKVQRIDDAERQRA